MTSNLLQSIETSTILSSLQHILADFNKLTFYQIGIFIKGLQYLNYKMSQSLPKRILCYFFEKPQSFPELLFFILRYLFLLDFLWIFINVCFFNSSSMWLFNMLLSVTIAGVILVALFYLIYKIKKYSKTHLRFTILIGRHNAAIAAAGLAILFIFQLILAQAIYRPIGWDCSAIVSCAVKGSLTSERAYFSNYPNNLLMYWILEKLLKAFFYFGGKNYWLFLSIVNIMIIDSAIYLVFVICKKLFGLACGFTSYVLFILIFGLSPWLVVPYSDTFSMAFIPLVLLLFLKFQESNNFILKGILLFLIGFVSIVGFYMKPYTLVAFVSIMIYLLIHSINSIKKIGIFFLTALMMLTGAAGSFLLYNGAIKDTYSNVLDYSQALPMSYYFMMGLNTTTSGGTGRTLYGAYSGADNLFVYTLPTPEKKQSETLRVAFERIKAYTPKGYVQFLSNKANWVFSDGTFWVEGEGYDVDRPSVSTTDLSKWIQSYFRFYGTNYVVFASLMQGIWVLLLFLLICPLFNNSDDYKKPIVNILRIAALGFLFYEMLFEARSRYLIAVLPIIIILATSGFSHFHENFYSYQEDDDIVSI